MINRGAVKEEVRRIILGARVSPILVTLLVMAIVFVLERVTDLVEGGSLFYSYGLAGRYYDALVSSDPGDLEALLYLLPRPTGMTFFFSVLVSLVGLVLNGGYYIYCMGIRRGVEMPYATLADGLGVGAAVVSPTFNIVLAVFDVSQHVIQQSAGIIQNGTEITTDVMDSLRTELEAMELGPLFGLWLQSFLIQLTMIALNIVIFVIVYGRMIEIYLLTSLAPIPFATVVATHFSCPIITLVVCHRINRYNDMGTEKGKGFRTLIFCTELSPETITKTMVIISKYEVEYKETEDIFNRQ